MFYLNMQESQANSNLLIVRTKLRKKLNSLLLIKIVLFASRYLYSKTSSD